MGKRGLHHRVLKINISPSLALLMETVETRIGEGFMRLHAQRAGAPNRKMEIDDVR